MYTAQGWLELGQTDGFGRHRRDFYVAHDKPKRLFAKEPARNARRRLQAEMGMFRRLVLSLFMHWRGRQPKSHHKTLTDFQAAKGEDNPTQAMAVVTRPRPKID